MFEISEEISITIIFLLFVLFMFTFNLWLHHLLTELLLILLLRHHYRSCVLHILSSHQLHIPPNSTSIILRSSNDCISTVIKSARKNIIFMTIKNLLLNTCVCVPYPTRFVTRSCDDLISL